MEIYSRPAIYQSRSKREWLKIGFICVYLVFCCIVFTLSVEPIYGSFDTYGIEADSAFYYDAAGVRGSPETQDTEQTGFGASSFGPELVATIFRNSYGVACFDFLAFGATLYVAGLIPGVRQFTFGCLMALDAYTVPAVTTLNKEILALLGVVLFAKYLYVKKRTWWLLGLALFVSAMARWQQSAFFLIFLAMQSKRFSLSKRPKLAIAALLICASIGWAVIAIKYNAVLEVYIELQNSITSGTISRLNAIQSKGGFIAVVWPKILMNISGRLLQVDYILHEWIHDDFHDLQNTVIGNLHSVALLMMLFVMIVRGRFRLARPLVVLTMVYFILSSISPLIQNRYEYPAYALLALEMSRDKQTLEPVKKRISSKLSHSLRALQVAHQDKC